MRSIIWWLAVAGILVAGLRPAGAQSVSISEYTIPTANGHPGGITGVIISGNDDIWFTEIDGNKIGRLTPDGKITEFPIPTKNSLSGKITSATASNPSGFALWFTEYLGNKIGRLTPDGTITEFPIPTANGLPGGIVFDLVGELLWFTENAGNKIGRVTSTGAITEFPIPTANSHPEGIAIAHAGDLTHPGTLWFTEAEANKIGRLTPDGKITEFPIPTANSIPEGITVADNIVPENEIIWFTEALGNKIGRLTPDGTITEFPIPTANSHPEGITLYYLGGPLPVIWFTENAASKIGRLTPDGTITEFPIPTANGGPLDIVGGWFTENSGNKLGQIAVPTTTATATRTPTPTPKPTLPATITPIRSSFTPTPPSTLRACVGDCGGIETVAINDLITLVTIALGSAQPAACPNGVPSGTEIDIALIIQAVDNALNGCGNASAPPVISISPQTASPFGIVTVNVANPNPTASQSVVFDLGPGYDVELPLQPGGGSSFQVVVPPGVVDAVNGFVAGQIGVRLSNTVNGITSLSDSVPLQVLSLPQATGVPGDVTKAILQAAMLLSQRSIPDLQAIGTQASLDVSGPVQDSGTIGTDVGQLSALLNQVPVTLGSSGAVFGQNSVKVADRVFLGFLQSLNQPGAIVTGSVDLLDIKGLANSIASDVRGRVSSLLGVTTAVAALTVGIPATPVFALGVFMATTGVITADSVILDLAPTAISTGRANVGQLEASAQFLVSSVVDAGLSVIKEKGLTSLVGETLGGSVATGYDLLTKLHEFLKDDVEQAFNDGRLPLPIEGGTPTPTPFVQTCCQDTSDNRPPNDTCGQCTRGVPVIDGCPSGYVIVHDDACQERCPYGCNGVPSPRCCTF